MFPDFFSKNKFDWCAYQLFSRSHFHSTTRAWSAAIGAVGSRVGLIIQRSSVRSRLAAHESVPGTLEVLVGLSRENAVRTLFVNDLWSRKPACRVFVDKAIKGRAKDKTHI